MEDRTEMCAENLHTVVSEHLQLLQTDWGGGIFGNLDLKRSKIYFKLSKLH